MPTIDLNIDAAVFNPVYRPYLNDNTRTQIYFGGSSSGKSYFLAQRCVLDVAQGGRNYLVTRKVARTIRRSVFNEVINAISFFNLTKFFTVNQSDLVITCDNGYQILFAGLDDVEKIKSITPAKGVITDIWEEEATEDDYEDDKQLDKRLRGSSSAIKRRIKSFNPVYKTHWMYKEWFEGRWQDGNSLYKDDDLLILKTTYRDNKFLTDDDIKALVTERDPYYRAVYTEGDWGVLGKVIFTNWRTEDLSEKQELWHTWQNGLDFGFANDPSAFVRCHYERRENALYIAQANYYFGLTNDLLAPELKKYISQELITCDSAAPLNIAELRRDSVNAVPCVKFKDSVNYGIQWLQKLQIIIDYRLRDAINEFTTYKWAEDKDGNVLPEPVDKNNHIIDAIRYALNREMGRNNDDMRQEVISKHNPFDRRR